jgi:predicted metalloendopeptidase
MQLAFRVSCSASVLLLVAACSTAPKAHPTMPSPAPASATEKAAPITLAESGIVTAWMDPNVPACEDFYAYACGGFLATAQIPPDRASFSAIAVVEQETENFLSDVLERAATSGSDPVVQKLGDYYAACMDENAIESLGLKPLAAPRAVIAKVHDEKSAAQAVIALHQLAVFPLFDLGPAQDFADATQVILALDQDGLGLPDRKYYLENGKMKAQREAYLAHVERMFRLYGVREAELKEAVADVLRIETSIAKLSQDMVVRRDPHAVYHRVDRAGLNALAPSFPWAEYFRALGIPDVQAITVNDPAYFTGVTRLLRDEKPSALAHYFTWTLLHDSAADLSSAFVAEDFALDQLLSGVQEIAPRWRRCVARVDADLGELLAQPYVAARFAGDSKLRATELTKAVLDAMSLELDRLPWMDDATRLSAHQKLTRMSSLIGYPERFREYDFVVDRKAYGENRMAATKFELARQLRKIGKPVDRQDWLMTPPTVNAYYEPTLNQLALPAGQLQPPFFGATFHPAVNFGATGGGTIGHEMTHGFDDEGSQFDAAGNLRDWWSPETKAAFASATECVVEQYGAYEAVPGVKLDGKLTAGENIADIGGVKIAFLAYQAFRAHASSPPPAQVEGLSDEQLYFLAYAQSWCAKLTPELLETMAHTNPHSPPRYRVNGVVVDQPGFAAAYGCAVGTPMNPGHACEIW